MKIRWSVDAFSDFERIITYVRKRSPNGAEALARRIYSEIGMLEEFPELARPGRTEGTRDLVIAPYIVVYQIKDNLVELLNIYHGAQDWP